MMSEELEEDELDIHEIRKKHLPLIKNFVAAMHTQNIYIYMKIDLYMYVHCETLISLK